jgi:hypothetical protein
MPLGLAPPSPIDFSRSPHCSQGRRGIVEFQQNLLLDCSRRSQRLHRQRRMGDRHDGLSEQPDRAQWRRLRGTVPDRQIGPFRHQVEHLVVCRQTDVDVRVALLKLAKPGQQPKRRDPDARRDGHGRPLPVAPQRFKSVLKLLDGIVGDAEQPLAFRGETDGPVTPVQQLDTQGLLKRLNLPADRRLRQA